MTDTRSSELNATIVRRIDVTPELVRIFVRPDKAYPPFLPGQYVALGLPGESPRPNHFPPEEQSHDPHKLIKRAYSIGSPPSDPSVLEFYLAILPQGALTARIACLREGDRIFIERKIIGTFVVDHVPHSANLVFVSTGTGIAPFIAMIRTPEVWCEGRAITIVHGVRYATDFAYQEEIRECQKEHSLRYYQIASRAGAEWSGQRGHVQYFFESGEIALDATRDHVFLCGNPAMIDDVQALLCARGYQVHSKRNPGNLHLEKYW